MRCWPLLLQFTLPQRKRYAYMSVSEFRSRLQFTFPYRDVFQSVLSQFPLSYYNLRPLLGVLYRFAQYEIFLILQFTFQQQSVLKAKTMLNNEAIAIHVPTQERYNRCYFEVYFNSHSHVGSVPQILVLAYTFYNSRSRIGNAMKIVATCLITIHVPTQGAPGITYFISFGLPLQFTLPHREHLTGSGPGPTQMRLQFTLPYRECSYKVPNIGLIINFNSRSHIGSADIQKIGICLCGYCNSRSRIGSAIAQIATELKLSITIHAPAQGAPESHPCTFVLPLISIHAPIQGAPASLRILQCRLYNYNSRSRIGSAVNIQTNTTTQPKILYNLSSLRT